MWPYLKFIRLDPFDDENLFKRVISKNIPGTGYQYFQKFIGPVMLRRTKNTKYQGKPILNLPNKNVYLVEFELYPDERRE